MTAFEYRPDTCRCSHHIDEHDAGQCWEYTYMGQQCDCAGFDHDPYNGATPQQIVDEWNKRWKPGTPVRYWTGERRGPGVDSATRTAASVFPGGTPVVWVEGHSACIALTHVRPLEGAGCAEHPLDERCIECASDEELARAIGMRA